MRRFAKPSSRAPMRPSTTTPNTWNPKRFPAKPATLALRDYIRRKFEGRRIDVVVANTTPALQFVIRFREELFPRVPIVFLAGRIPEPIAQHTVAGITGVLSDSALGETLDLALRLHPSVKRVFVVAQAPTVEGYDDSDTSGARQVFGAGRAHLYQGEVAAWPPCRRQSDFPASSDSVQPLHSSRQRSRRLFRRGRTVHGRGLFSPNLRRHRSCISARASSAA